MTPFTFPGLTNRVIFGNGALAQTGAELDRMGGARALILCTPRQRPQAEALADQIGPRAAGIFAGAVMHTPVVVTETALDAFNAAGATVIVSMGGGSTIGLGKAIALRTDADQLVIPTTYAGSELTDILGETENGQKTTRRDPRIRPEAVIYDPDLTLDLHAQRKPSGARSVTCSPSSHPKNAQTTSPTQDMLPSNPEPL